MSAGSPWSAWWDGLWAHVLGLARRHPRRSLAGGMALVSLAVWLVAQRGAEPVATAEAREGPFRVSVVESGTLQALRSLTYSSSISSNQAKIVALAPEGQWVKSGDLLILFDATPFEEEIRGSQAALSQAEAELEKARQDYHLQGLQNTEELALAGQKVEHSDLDLKDVQEGRGRLKEEDAVREVADAERELARAAGVATDLRPLLAEGFITRQELEKADQELSRAQESLESTRRKRDAQVAFGRPLELSQARSDATLSKQSLRQLESAVAYRLQQKRAAMAAAQSRIQEAGSKLEQARQQLARTEVRASAAGIVVYRPLSFGSERRKPQVGDQVWANQPLLILPDMSKMIVETRVRETDIHKIEKNQRVSVAVEAFPGLKLRGSVSLVGTLAQEEQERRGTRFFGLTILLEKNDERLRPGMSARVEIEVEQRARALWVPVDAVFEREGQSLAFVRTRGGFTPRELVLGPSNGDFVVVERGLTPGERVALRDPGAPPGDFSPAAPAP